MLTAYVKGSGSVGVNDGNQTYSKGITGASDWTEATVNFNSGNNTSVEVLYFKFKTAEGRFDAFSLESVGTSAPTPTPTPTPTPSGEISCSETLSQTIVNAIDNGTHDGHGPENTIDGVTTDESRWSSNGTGKTITFDLGQNTFSKSMDVTWYKGSSRSSFFDVDTSTDNNSWTSVLASASSSGSNSGFENHNLADSTARYVRITGNGNSSNTWNSIIETKINGCTDGTTPTPTPTPTLHQLLHQRQHLRQI